ncbi:MAG: acyl-CoA dehydrogenase [Actinobacteria bacterium]|jgi:alkylation response protein AidB-like acyl-CoA dehydrogenase|nr:acyl-CoA dehydrogenase [Actinomycetota bacterium]MBT3746891.1 acyl-CoA dehydrogenase [Actinomycetota bacterium]MBT3970224.1 acyl-CoA dehydrogenase [Actinomycetota bacterium]MBT4010147.1 acyl-CoA dehydrogenase [Actinomycetota bacterium]MBT4303082.1 acyl-CoA dehydrogenase [Actinomycetota bacterium]
MWNLTPQQEALQQRARELATEVIAPRAAEIDRTEQYPWDNVATLQEAGFTGMTVPQELGGLGHSFLDAVLVIEEMAKHCGVTGRIAVEANMGAISAVLAYGTESQRKMAAEFVLNGDKPAICITEPDAGSAASLMTTRADKRGNTYVLNGKKHWITGGGVSKLHLIFARVFDEQGQEQGIGGFLAIRDETPGLSFGKREPTMGLRGIPEMEVIFKDMEVAADMVLLPPSGFRRGFADLMNAYNSQRVGAGTVGLGIAAGAYQRALEFAKEREQFDRPIAEFQGLQWMLADMCTKLEAARSLLYRAAESRGSQDSPFPDASLAAQAKIFAAETSIEVTNDALQVFGAAGYSRNNPLERMYRDVRMFTIGGGTAQILRTVVASRILEQKLPQTRDGYRKMMG